MIFFAREWSYVFSRWCKLSALVLVTFVQEVIRKKNIGKVYEIYSKDFYKKFLLDDKDKEFLKFFRKNFTK